MKMSKTPKRKSINQNNTLFNYFKSPKIEKEQVKALEVDKEKLPSILKQEDNTSDDEDVIRSQKRRRIVVQSDSEGSNEDLSKIPEESDNRKKIKIENKTNGHNINLEEFTFNKTDPSDDVSLKFTSINDLKKSSAPDNTLGLHNNWKHNHLPFLQSDKIKDKNKHKPDHPEYDCRTLYIPDDFLNSQTPAMRQWWILKSEHMDTVFFFKVGKFYELYHMDAVVGVQQLGFSYMKGEFAHSGFPESAYAKMTSILIEKGYKVARIEQTETPEMMSERCKSQKKTTKYDKVVKREICQISTKATMVYNAQFPEAPQPMSYYLFAICEKKIQNGIRFGISFVDTSIGTFHLAEFDDDKHCSKLLALCSEHKPELILFEKGRQNVLNEIFNTYFRDIKKEALNSSQFSPAEKTLETLATGVYFIDKGTFKWPDIFKELSDECIPKPGYELALKSLGACIWCLKNSQLDIHVLSMKKFQFYQPKDVNCKATKLDYMILDSVTMNNLKLLGSHGSLQKNIDFCETPFGKRLLHQWICRPLCNVDKIKERQAAIKELTLHTDILKRTQAILKKLPDLERQIAKIHNFGNKSCSESHPDSRAIFYESKTYSKRKIHDLLNTLKGFESAQEITEIFQNCSSKLLRKLTQNDGGMFLDLTETLNFFRNAFDQQKASEEGVIIPAQGVDEDYDAVMEKIDEINRELDVYLKQQEKYFGCKLNYFGSDKKRFQLEIPDTHGKKVTSDYHLEGTKKGNKPCKRYHTEETRAFLRDMLYAEAEKAKIIQDLNRRIFEKFSERRAEWEQVTHCLTYLDVLSSLATYANLSSHDVCLPEILPFDQEKNMIKLKNARHPCITNIENFVPNDVSMNCDGKAGLVIITGPNMGGKSTLMGQIAVLVVLSQMGGYVPASECRINLVDRIFTRLGAKDNIIGGQSTFFVELSEASSILKHASEYSLVLSDELGRGTSTHDGNAIASAFARKLIEIKCRALFSTHYHTLVDHFIDRTDVQLGHMACMVENDDDPTQESVIFLYKLASGRCPKSYGFNAARLAGLKHSLVRNAREIAKIFETQCKVRDLARKILLSPTDNVKNLISSLKDMKF